MERTFDYVNQLREQYVGQVVAGMLGNAAVNVWKVEKLVENAYEIADFMIVERLKNPIPEEAFDGVKN